ncbi:TlpA family protein disulfide reductase [Pseudarcicella hirudinis]|uniref:TlpA family protein disulfide reductase n=1 Tax=Pseudarcicella hirudinis TaxID=1079859 RepID=UPI0035EA7157
MSLGGWASQAAKFFNINAIPRYILINKEGVIVNNNARRPSDPAILNDILQLTEGKK